MSTSDAEGIDPLTGYPAQPDSSPAGASQEGVPPDAGDATPLGSPDSQTDVNPYVRADDPKGYQARMNELYAKQKAAERELESYRQRDLEQSYEAPPAVDHRQVPESEPVADEWGEFRKIIREEVQSTVQPMQDTFAQTQRAAAIERARADLKKIAPQYDPAQHDAELASAVRQYGVNNLTAAARIAHPEWFVASAPETPVADVQASAPGPARSNVAELHAELRDPRTSTDRRQEIATLLSNMDSSVEKALGW